jgi:molybdopterin-dependent oxidoreductase alpha subunit
MLLELSFMNLIDNDVNDLFIVNKKNTDDYWLDRIQHLLMLNGSRLSIKKALSLVNINSDEIIETYLKKLIKSGILISKGNLWSENSEVLYYKQDFKLSSEIRNRIRDAVLTDNIPDPRDTVIINLMQACNLTHYLFSSQELVKSKQRIKLLSNLELIGQKIFSEIKILEGFTSEQTISELLDIKYNKSNAAAGGMTAVKSAIDNILSQTGIFKATTLLKNVNQKSGFDCPGCAWPDPDKKRSKFEFCENGVKSIASEATDLVITEEFFAKWSIDELLQQSDYWLEKQGRLIHPMILREGSQHYEPVTYSEAFKLIANKLFDLQTPQEAVFYTSGKASNESAFLFQLLARAFGSNNLSGSSNLCHDPSGKALINTLGFSKGTVGPDDFEIADAIYIFGQNPGSNHPRMLKSLVNAVKNGCEIVAVNPIIEPSLVNFSNPQDFSLIKNSSTKIASLYIQPKINGDLAFIKGIIKYIFEEDEKLSNIIDKKFVESNTSGYNELKDSIKSENWDYIVENSGVKKSEIEEAAKIYLHADKVIISWCLGITHHKNSVLTIQEIVNLLLLRGNIGKKGAGICPVRGHSSVQGNKTVGINSNIAPGIKSRLNQYYGINTPELQGLDAISSIQEMFNNNIKVFISLGGNLAAAAPDKDYTEKAFSKCDLTVMISTKLNRSHLITGKNAIILPCLARTEKDIKNGKLQSVSVEDLESIIRLSKGCVTPISNELQSDIEIISQIAKELFEDKNYSIPWERFAIDYNFIRENIIKVIPEFGIFNEINDEKKIYQLYNPIKDRNFLTDTKKAKFTINPISPIKLEHNQLLLMSIRSHDQFNTTIFGLNDRYRGIKNERKVVFLNSEDMKSMNLAAGQQVDIISNYDNRERTLFKYFAIPHNISKGCAAIYFPEANVLTSINNLEDSCNTPAYKSIIVKIIPSEGI